MGGFGCYIVAFFMTFINYLGFAGLVGSMP